MFAPPVHSVSAVFRPFQGIIYSSLGEIRKYLKQMYKTDGCWCYEPITSVNLMAYRDMFWLLILKYIQLYFPVTIVCLCHISTAWSNDSSTKMFLLVFHKLKFLIVPRTLIRTTSVKDPIELGRYTKVGSEHCRPLIGQRESSLGRTWTFCTNLQSH